MNMRNGRTLMRLGAGAATVIAAGALVGPAGPAHAADAKPDLDISAPGAGITLDATSKAVRVDLKNNGTATATNVKVTITVNDLNGVSVFLPGGGCDAVTNGISCPMPDLGAGETDVFGFLIALDGTGTTPGTAGHVTLKVQSAQSDAKPSDNTSVVPLEIKAPGVDLTVYATDLRDAAPGSTTDLQWGVWNQGGTTASSVSVDFVVPAYAAIQNTLGCVVASDGRSAHCEGPALSSSDGPVFFPISVKISPVAPGPVNLGRGLVAASGAPANVPSAARKASAVRKFSRFTAKNSQSGANDQVPGDNSVQFAVTTTDNPNDLQVTAGTASGAVGSTVKAPVTVQNNGVSDSPHTILALKAPSGTEIVDADITAHCTAVTAGREYRCDIGTLTKADGAGTRNAAFKIDTAAVGDDGTAQISGPARDKNPANNTAKIVITVAAGGGTGGGGGSLPVTGVKAGLIGGIGGLVLIVGAVLVVMSRRRRVLMVTPTDEV
jgi:hypothetical protein